MKSVTTEEPRPIGIWIRVSTEDQAKGESPEHHEQRARYYAQAKGWDVTEVYHLEGVSGKFVSQHPEAQRMLKDIRSGSIRALIFSKLARLARNTKELLEFADIFRGCDADLVSLQESIDTSTPARAALLHDDRCNGAVGTRGNHRANRRPLCRSEQSLASRWAVVPNSVTSGKIESSSFIQKKDQSGD